MSQGSLRDRPPLTELHWWRCALVFLMCARECHFPDRISQRARHPFFPDVTKSIDSKLVTYGKRQKVTEVHVLKCRSK